MLGLCSQVPARLVYLTDGPSRSISIGKQPIRLFHADLHEMLGAGQTSGLVLLALRHLGSDNVDAAVVNRLRVVLSDSDKLQLRTYATSVPGWMADAITRIDARTVEGGAEV